MLIYQSFRVLFHINCTDFAKSLGSGFAAGGSTRRSQASSGGFFFSGDLLQGIHGVFSKSLT